MRWLVVDDHPLMRDALGQVLRRLDADAEVRHAGCCEQGLASVDEAAPPALVLLDLNLPGLSGIDALRAWRRRFPALPVVVLSADQRRATVLAALDSGAAGFVPKSTGHDLMVGALRLVLDGGRYLPPELLAGEPVAPAGGALGLTLRQMDVLRWVARGAPNKVIGRELGMAERTVKAHVTAALRALNVGSRTQLALEATRLGLALPEPGTGQR